MLLRFGMANHLSVCDSQELSLVTSSLKDGNKGLIDCKAVPKGSVLPAVVIYGANASGKSNIIDALTTMRSMVLWSQSKGNPDGGVRRHPFLLDNINSKKSSYFDIDFVIDGVRHHYGFEVSDIAFESEWLYTFPRSHRRMLFERDGMKFRFGRELKGQNNNIARLTRQNSLYLSAAAQNSHQQLSKIFQFFQSIKTIREIAISCTAATLKLLNEGREEPDQRVIDFLEKIDTGVISCRRRNTDNSEASLGIGKVFSMFMDMQWSEPFEYDQVADNKFVDTELGHRGLDGETFYLDLDRESAGTRRLLVALTRVFRVLDQGALLCIDELDASLHTHASEAVLKLFCSRKTNRKGAQLIATTHDTNLMMSSALRRDQLWLTEKETNGATQLYPLTDFRTRREDNIEKGYLDGRFGAVPSGDPIASLGTQT